jgi:hypothetical protein
MNSPRRLAPSQVEVIGREIGGEIGLVQGGGLEDGRELIA